MGRMTTHKSPGICLSHPSEGAPAAARRCSYAAVAGMPTAVPTVLKRCDVHATPAMAPLVIVGVMNGGARECPPKTYMCQIDS